MVNIENTHKALTILALVLATVFVGRSALADSSTQKDSLPAPLLLSH